MYNPDGEPEERKSLTIKQLIEESHATAKEKGWWDDDRNIPTQIALMHSELSEALEEYRNSDGSGRAMKQTRVVGGNHLQIGKPEGFAIELADVLIRIADTCGRYGIDLESALQEKLAYNKTRPHRHGGKKV